MINTADIDVLARTIYGEARGELQKPRGGLAALMAVGNVVMNRFHLKSYGPSVQAVCLQPYQFSCWNSNDPNLPVLRQIERGENGVFDVCYLVAEGLTQKEWPDLTDGCTHYHANWMKPYPFWTKGLLPASVIGDHLFYRI